MICSLDINECRLRKTKCSPNAQCINTKGSYNCKCQDGYEGDGEKCYDVNECDRNPCNFNAVCRNTDGSYTCSCKTGFQGDGQWCYDYDECMTGFHDCHQKQYVWIHGDRIAVRVPEGIMEMVKSVKVRDCVMSDTVKIPRVGKFLAMVELCHPVLQIQTLFQTKTSHFNFHTRFQTSLLKVVISL